MSVTVTKSQIRPRRRRVRLDNAEILSLDTSGVIPILGPAPLGYSWSITSVQVQTNIQMVYGNIDPTATLAIADDAASVLFDEAGTWPAITGLFATPFGPLGVGSGGVPLQGLDAGGTETSFVGPFGWTDYATLAAFGGILLLFSNGGADLNGGDPANFVDFFINYEIVNLIEG